MPPIRALNQHVASGVPEHPDATEENVRPAVAIEIGKGEMPGKPELVRLKVDILVVFGPPGVRAARAATNTIPIVMARMDDAEEHGFVASLARPGGNITGLSFQTGA